MSRRLATRLLVVGPDGSGKSTLTGELVNRLRSNGLRVRHLHFDPAVLASDSMDVVDAPHGKSPRQFGQFLSVIARFLRYRKSAAFGPLALKGVDLIIQERGWLDQTIDPVRYRLKPSGAVVVKMLNFLVPRVDSILVLYGDARLIVERKAELAESEVQRQIADWRRAALQFSNAAEIETIENLPAQSVELANDFCRESRGVTLRSNMSRVAFVPARLEMVASRASRPAIRSLYKPASTVGVMSRSFARPNRLCPSTTSIVTQVVAEVLSSLAISLDGVAAIKSNGRERIVIAVTTDQKVREFIKVDLSKTGGLEMEACAIENARSIRDLVRLPTVIGLETQTNWQALRLSALEGSASLSRPDLKSVIDIAVALRWCNEGDGMTHGDLAPWNLIAGAPWGLIDWEFASGNFVPGADLSDYMRTIGLISGNLNIDHCRNSTVRNALGRYGERCDLTFEQLLDAATHRIVGEGDT